MKVGDANLPDLPREYFWKITENTRSYSMSIVRVKKHPLYYTLWVWLLSLIEFDPEWEREEEFTILTDNGVDLTKEAIEAAASALTKQLREYLDAQERKALYLGRH